MHRHFPSCYKLVAGDKEGTSKYPFKAFGCLQIVHPFTFYFLLFTLKNRRYKYLWAFAASLPDKNKIALYLPLNNLSGGK